MRHLLGTAALGAMTAANYLWEKATGAQAKRLKELEKRRHEAAADPIALQTVYQGERDSSPTWQERIVSNEEV